MRKEINQILQYPDNSAGSIMTTEYVSLRPTMTVGEAITHIRRTGLDRDFLRSDEPAAMLLRVTFLHVICGCGKV